MAQLAKLRLLFGSAMMPAIAIVLLLLFIVYAIIGPNGILAWGDYSRQVRQRQAELKMLQAQKAALAWFEAHRARGGTSQLPGSEKSKI